MHVPSGAVSTGILHLPARVVVTTATISLLRLALALLRSSGFTLTHERLPNGGAKIRILRAVDRARAFVPLRTLLRFLRVSPSRFHAWRRLQHACALDDQSSCPHRSPHRLTPLEVRGIEDMVTAELFPGTFCTLPRELSSHGRSGSDRRTPVCLRGVERREGTINDHRL